MYYFIWAIVLIIIFYITIKCCRQYMYFKKWGIPGPRELPFIGLLGLDILRKYHVNYRMRNLYNFNKQAKYIGVHMFTQPIVIVRDHELIKSILVKNFDHFENRRAFINENIDPLFGKNLFMQNGEKWRDLRNLLSPSFTASKMRSMFVLMSNCAENFVKQVMELHADGAPVDMKDLFSRYANDVIASCAFGIEVDSMKDPENEFYVRGRRSTNFAELRWKMLMLFLLPTFLSKRYVRIVEKEDTDFFVKVIEDAIKTRKEKGITRPDMLQLMIDAQDKSKELDILEMTAQAFIFFFGGFETTSSHMCMMAYHLTVQFDEDRQMKVQLEVDEVMKKSGGKPTYDDIANMPYLDAVFAETMRLHPLAVTSRVCSNYFEFPPAVPGAKSFPVYPGTEIWIPVAGIHRDPEFFTCAEGFYPENFLKQQKPFRADVLNQGFGLGPRMCIGKRFAILETKILFVHLLAKCRLFSCQKTCVMLGYDLNNMSPAPRGGTWLEVVKRIS